MPSSVWRPLFCIAVFLMSQGLCEAQDLGGLPARLDWEIIKSKYVNVITTPEAESFARRTQTIDQALIELQPLSLGGRLRAIDIVIQNETVVPNGFVGLEPFRSYSYTSPPQQQSLLSTTEWVDLLSIHEFRHVEQFTNLRRGGTKLASFIFGQGGWSAVMGLTTPDWFSEGDAVVSETTLTYGGRGRTPDFTALQRAIALSGKQYSYHKARNGSFRSRVPDHYPLGYALTMYGWLSNKNLWPKVIKKTGNAWPPIYPFSLSLKQQTGKNTRDYYKMVYDSLTTVWKAELKATELTNHKPIPNLLTQLDVYTNPIPLSKGLSLDKHAKDNGQTLIAERSNQVRAREIVIVDTDGLVKPIVTQGSTVDGSMHFAGKNAVWTQLQNHPRRPNQISNELMCLDLESGKTKQLSKVACYFSPGLNSDGSQVVVVEKVPHKPARLKILSAVDGSLVQLVDETLTQAYDLLISPRFTADNQSIVVVAKHKDAIALFRFDLDKSSQAQAKSEQLTPWTRHVIGTPFVYEDYVYFSASFTGIDNIFRVGLAGKGQIEQVSSVAVSATQPSVDEQNLYFIEVSAEGNPISVLPKADWLNKPIEIVEPADMPRYAHLAFDGASKTFRDRFYKRSVEQNIGQTNQKILTSENNENETEVTTYRGLLRGFQFYTFQPLADQNQVSGTIFGGNKLNDLSAQVTAGRNLNESRNFINANVILARTWPWISGSFSSTNRNVVYLSGDNMIQFRRSRFLETSVGTRLDFPLSKEFGEYRIRFRPFLGAEYLSLSSEVGELPGTSALGAGDLGFSYSRIQRIGPKQIVPRKGQQLTMRLRRSLSGARETSQQFSATAGVFLPGFSPSHGLQLRVHARAEAITNNYQFADFYPYARGYVKTPNSSALGFSFNYHFPFAYPDVGALGLVYVRRLRANIWADATRLLLPEVFFDRDDLYASVGLDLTMDATFFNVEDLPVGVRFAYRLRTDDFGINSRGFVVPQLLFTLPL